MDRPHITIYTDGGASPNPGPGGWGAVLIHPQKTRELSDGDPHTTNNRMELTAAIESLRALTRPCVIELYTDSQYLRRGITQWIYSWIERDWNGVANADLWQELHELQAKHEIHWHWVAGHTGETHNERAHELASAAIPHVEAVPQADMTLVYLRFAGPEKGANGKCGWAVAIVRDDETETIVGSAADVPINRGVLLAIQDVLLQLSPDEAIQFFVKQDYVYNGMTGWMKTWAREGWTRNIKHKDLWMALHEQVAGRSIVWERLRNTPPPEYKALDAPAKAARDGA